MNMERLEDLADMVTAALKGDSLKYTIRYAVGWVQNMSVSCDVVVMRLRFYATST